jgi:Fur family peroxide stress response transcriptional regulator
MAVDEKEIERRVQAFIRACKAAGSKVTAQRIEIFREIAGSEEHPDAEVVFKGVRTRLPAVSLDTVYRTLWWLAGMGLVKTLGPVQDRTRFDANLSRHHHFVCIRCGLTRDFPSEALDRLQLPDTVAALGSIERTQVEVKGVCHACTAKENKNNP